jgi:methyl-accepting chemotaxis protein
VDQLALRLKTLLRSAGIQSFSFGNPIDVLTQVQALTIRSAVGSASTAVRLDSVSSQAKQASASLDEMLSTTEQLHVQFQHVSDAAAKTSLAAGEMQRLSTNGRDLSREAMESSAELQSQMQATVEHIERLVQGVTSIIRVSETIEAIAQQMTLLSFNATIEAARAGDQGRGFAVVAAEVRSLAQHTEARTREIKTMLDELATELAPTRSALQLSRNLVNSAADDVQSVGKSLKRIAELAIDTDRDMNAVASVVNEFSEGIASIFGNLKTSTASSEMIAKDAKALVSANFAVSQMVEQCFEQFGKVSLETQFHRNLRKARELARMAGEVFAHAIDGGLCALEDILAFDYREIKGADIAKLNRLFDVSRVPPGGFNPPKFATRYDSVCDLELQRAMDQIKASEPSLLYATVCDLNLYMPTHHAECSQDWTGDPKRDTPGNRIKRFFHDKWTNTDGVRVGFGPNGLTLANRASRQQFIDAGCEMHEQPGSAEKFSVKLTVRDAHTVVVVVHVPIFVKGHRYGAVACGWIATEDETAQTVRNAPAYMRLVRSSPLHSIGAKVNPTKVLADVQALTSKSAIAAAVTGLRLNSVNAQVEQTNASLESMLRTASELSTQFQQVAHASAKTLTAAAEMERLSAGGRDLSERATGSSGQLQTQMLATTAHIEKLVRGVSAIVSVSETIQAIARQMTLLSFNATIEAARAGEQGKGFAVVASEVRSLAQHTQTRTKEIKTILDGLATELAPVHDALQTSRQLTDSTADGVQKVGVALERIAELATDTDRNMDAVATVVKDLGGGVGSLLVNLKAITASSEAIEKDTHVLVGANFSVLVKVEERFVQFARINMDTAFHRGLRKARELAQLARGVFEAAIDDERCSLDDVLSCEYREIRGAEIQTLARLFDVSRVPARGFDPPKYATRYDSVVDVDLQRMMDRVKSSEPGLLYATVVDLNLYMPIHHAELCRDWTGIPEQDIAGNRIKRFFYDKYTTTEGARIGLGPMAAEVPDRASRDQFIEAGCEMRERAEDEDLFSVKIQVRDAGTVLIAVHVPLFVKSHRWGIALCGWNVAEDQAMPDA